MNRPTGITILAWVAIIGGAIGVLGSIAAVFGSLALIGFGAALAGPAGFMVGVEALLSSIASIVIGALSIWFGVGALNLKPSAWSLGVLLAYIDAVWVVFYALLVLVTHPAAFIGALFGAIISLAITLVLLWYLFTDEVKTAFGKSSEQPLSFLAPILVQIDGMFAGGRGRTQPPQQTGGYQPPPQAPGGYPGPQAPAHYDAPTPSAPPTSGGDIPAPPAPPA